MALPLIPITRKQALLFAVFLVLYEFLTYIANDMIMPGMLNVVEAFHAPESSIATSLTMYILGGASLQLILGPLSDAYGRRPVMIFGALFFFLCTIFIACSYSIVSFLVARFFQGMGLCFIGVIGYATLQEIFAEMDAIRLIAVMANVSTIAPLIGPSLGAVFILHFQWRFMFVGIAVLALLALWGLWRYMPEPVGQTKRDGQRIQPVSFRFGAIFNNYKALSLNPAFMCGSLALGFLALPCVAWIALAPVILVSEAHLTVLEYGLWQIPLFGALIVGNIYLHRLTHKKGVVPLIFLGSVISIASLLLTYIIPQFYSQHYLSLMPGLILNFFGLGLTGAPLNRFILFSTPVGKGTTAALESMIGMSIQAAGIEIANWMYTSHQNKLFGLFYAGVGVMYGVFALSALYFGKPYFQEEKK